MSKKQKRMLFRVLASAVLFAVALLLPTEGWLRLFTFLIPYAVIAWDVLWRAVRNIAHGQVFDENFLMSLATVRPWPRVNTPRPYSSCCSTRWASSFRATLWTSPASPSPP